MAKIFDMGANLPDWEKCYTEEYQNLPLIRKMGEDDSSFRARVKKEPLFIHTPCPCIFIYSDYKTIDTSLQNIYPNSEKDFWAAKKEFYIRLWSKDWRFDPELPYFDNYKHKNAHLFVKKSLDEMIAFRTCKFDNEVYDNFENHSERVFNLLFWPCPPGEVMEVGQKAGLFLSPEEEEKRKIEQEIMTEPDPAIRRMRRIALSLKEE